MELSSSHRSALASTLAGAGAIHFAMAPMHGGTMGAAFALVGAAQLALALIVTSAPSRRVLLGVVALSAASIAAWAVSRTVGLPFGEHAGDPEAIAAVDLACVALQIAAGVLALRAALLPSLPISRYGGRLLPIGATLLTLGVLVSPSTATHGNVERDAAHAHGDTTGVVAGGASDHHLDDEATDAEVALVSTHDEDEDEPHPHASNDTMAATTTSSLSGSTPAMTVPADDHAHANTAAPTVTMPGAPTAAAPAHDHATPADTTATTEPAHDHPATTVPGGPTAGPVHNHGECTAPVTAAQQAAADALAAQTIAGLHQFLDIADAEAAGFVPITPLNLKLVHYANPGWYLDGRVLDPNKPESLMYAIPPTGAPILLGAMFLMENGEPGPQVGGCLTQWHVHDNLCLADQGGRMVGVVDANGQCPAGSSNRVTPEMLHVWGIDVPGGPFSEPSGTEIRDSLIGGSRIA